MTFLLLIEDSCTTTPYVLQYLVLLLHEYRYEVDVV
jgi:hypothetical protein